MSNPFQYLQKVKQEAQKVTWPTRKETLITTGLVLAMVVFASMFFVLSDQIIRTFISFILGTR